MSGTLAGAEDAAEDLIDVVRGTFADALRFGRLVDEEILALTLPRGFRPRSRPWRVTGQTGQ